MISTLFFLWFLLATAWTINALRRPVPPGQRFPPLWLPGMIVSELAPILFVERGLVALVFLALGAANTTIGAVGLWLFAFSQIGLLVLMARTVVAAGESGVGISSWTVFRVWDSLPEGVEVHVEIEYGEGLTLDLYSKPTTGPSPTLIYVHPGSWMRGRPGRQAKAMFHQLTRDGWVVLDIRYPLSPAATFPEHLVGVKKAIAWARTAGQYYGVDPGRIAISGGSSGAHLASLAALTWDRVDLQPGFEEADVSVSACLPFYGIYDLLIRNPTRYDWPFIARYVMKAKPTEAPDLYRLGSPVDQVRPDAPPFHVVHGELDSVVLASESEHFVKALTDAGAQVTYYEVRGAQHGFDAIASLRSRSVGLVCASWLNRMVDAP